MTPVFEASLGPRNSESRRALAEWTATRAVGEAPGLTVVPGGAVPTRRRLGDRTVLDVTLRGRLPDDSREGGLAFADGIRAALGSWEPRREHRFGLELEFGDDVRDITWVAEKPIKPVVDCLFPVLGGRPGAPDDWKVDELRVRRGLAELRGASRVMMEIGGFAGAAGPHVHAGETLTLRISGSGEPNESTRGSATRRTGMTNFDRLDEAAKSSGSPPAALSLSQILTRAAALFPEMANVSKDSASASMEYQTINVRGRAGRPGDFAAPDRWNRSPAFLKVGRGMWRRLSEQERATFQRLRTQGAPILKQESYEANEWDSLAGK